MSDEPSAADGKTGVDPEESLDDELKHLLKSAMRAEHGSSPHLVEGFQRKVRSRSGGKFYEEGWSTAKEPPVSTFLITSLVMLAIVFAIYAVLEPLAGSPTPVDNTPAPINVLSPQQVGTSRVAPVGSSPAPDATGSSAPAHK